MTPACQILEPAQRDAMWEAIRNYAKMLVEPTHVT